MAGRKLQWLFELYDRMSGPAKSIGKAVGDVQSKLKGVAGAATPATKASSGLASAFGGIGGKVLPMLAGLSMVASAAVTVGGALERVGEETLGLGFAGAKYAIEATSFKQNTERALTAILRSKEAAAGVLDMATKFAARTPFETKDVMQWSKSLLVGGFQTKELPVLLKAVGDFGALNDMDTGKITGLVEHLNKVKAEGKLTGRVMEELAVSGVNAGKIYEKLGVMFGTTAEGARKLEAAGKIDAQHGLYAIISQIKEMGGGKLGSLLEDASMGVEGLMSTIRSRPFELFKDMDKTGGYESFRQFLANIADLLDPGGSFGARLKERLQATFGDTFQLIFGQLGGASGKAGLESGLNKVVDLVEAVTGAVRIAWPFIREFGSGLFTGLANGLRPLGAVFELFRGAQGGAHLNVLASGLNMVGRIAAWAINVLVYLGAAFVGAAAGTMAFVSAIFALPDLIADAISTIGTWVATKAAEVWDWGKNLGTSLIDGITNGVKSAGGWVSDALNDVADVATGTWREATGTHSPSTVFAALGEGIPQGLSQGINSGANDVANSVEGLHQPEALSVSAGGGGGPQINVDVSVVFHGADSKTVEGVLERLNMTVRAAVEDALRGASVEAGAAAA